MAKQKTTLSAEEQREYTRMQQQVNKRLQRLEKHAADPKYKEIMNYSYKVFMKELKAMGMGKTMSKSIPKDRKQLMKRTNAMRRFLDMPTSRISGVQEVYEKRAGTLSKLMGEEVTWQDLAKVFESGLYDKLKNHYGSKTAMKMIGKIVREKEQIKADIEAGRNIRFKGEYGRRMNRAEMSDVLKHYLGADEDATKPSS